jgi:hypothetical protein
MFFFLCFPVVASGLLLDSRLRSPSWLAYQGESEVLGSHSFQKWEGVFGLWQVHFASFRCFICWNEVPLSSFSLVVLSSFL